MTDRHYWGLEPDPELERQEKLFFAIQEKNVTLVRQCLEEGIPVEPVRQHSPSNMGNLIKAVEGITKNDPSDPCIQILSLLLQAKGAEPFDMIPLGKAFLRATEHGLSVALDVLLPALPEGIDHRFARTNNLYWSAIKLCRSSDQYPFGRLGGPEMVQWLLNQPSELSSAPEKRLFERQEPLSKCLSEAANKSTLNKWERSNYRRTADTLLTATPLVISDEIPKASSMLTNMVIVATEPDSGYHHWLQLIVDSPSAQAAMERVRDKLTAAQWNGYREVLLESSLESQAPGKRSTLRF